MGAVLLGVLGLLSYMAFSGRAPCSSVNKAPCGVEKLYNLNFMELPIIG